jgi:hypothetical protein
MRRMSATELKAKILAVLDDVDAGPAFVPLPALPGLPTAPSRCFAEIRSIA